MFSINPFLLDYQRPKSYSLFNDDFYPFSSNRYYISEPAPSPFGRSFSFRRPQSSQYPATSFQQLRPERPESDEDELNDPFLDLFGLRSPSKSAARRKESNKTCDQPSRVQQSRAQQSNVEQPKVQPSTTQQSSVQQPKPVEARPEAREQPKKAVRSCEEKVLDSQRFDTDNEIEYRFSNYRCTSPSGVEVRITKENYIELRTADGWTWKCRLSDEVGDLQKASCTVLNGVLRLKLPKRTDVQAVQQEKAAEKQEVKDQEVKDEEMKETNEKQEKIEEQKGEEFDPDAPIVEDIYEDEEMN